MMAKKYIGGSGLGARILFQETSADTDPSTPLIGTIDGYRMLEILNDYTHAFFDKYLRGIESPLLSEPSSEYPEVKLRKK
jgi:hypothetical protein